MSKKKSRLFKITLDEMYSRLLSILDDMDYYVLHSSKGPGMMIGGDVFAGIIYVDDKLPIKKRLFVLCHEIGHGFFLDKNMTLTARQEPAGEDAANKTAIKLLRMADPALLPEFAKFYNRVNKDFIKSGSRSKLQT
jgi:Zn-dependent peptidase ImmA (M78 family)